MQNLQSERDSNQGRLARHRPRIDTLTMSQECTQCAWRLRYNRIKGEDEDGEERVRVSGMSGCFATP